MATIPNNEAWREFFECYKGLPELWMVKCDNFKDRNKKRSALGKLLDVYKQIDKDANIDSLKKRLINIRTCFRRELKKMEQSQRSGAGADETYIPNLWYFDTLEFLRDQETQIPGFSTIDIGEAEETEKAEVSNFNYVYSNLSLYAYLLSFFPNQNVLFSFYSVFSLFL